MTFILTCTSGEYIYQVSDRRLTMLGGLNSGVVVDDESNKSTLVGGRMSFCYTGLAEISGKRTDIWLAQTLANGPIQDLGVACERVRAQSTQEFRNLRRKRCPEHFLRHAFVGIGWCRLPEDDGLQPLLCTISNALDGNGEWLAQPSDEFLIRINGWGQSSEGFSIAGAGQTLRQDEKHAIWRHIRRCAKKKAGPIAFLRALIDAVFFVADRYSGVGSNLMATCMPRAAAEDYLRTGDSMAVYGLPHSNRNVFVYSSLERLHPIVYGPNVATEGIAITGFHAGPLDLASEDS
ncbi:hypothetical protein H6F88_00785 [Oculatella sp. FACHB-28]|uniref:hypothetical protein n=1 Tax=Oculatella sp. FACHB-28 TaxID=2692845 RepID=UPI001686563D|nr:hypothetical protein [Oculatella sp. FACHB-28]MBD2054578.1 hypothetical protein [Oculatella sp. FACHB-28]